MTDDEEAETQDRNAAESRPKKREQHRTKEKRKKELREQKVMEKKMALRRQRTRNRRYTSDEFTTFFSSSKRTLSNESYTNVPDDVAYSPPRRNVENVDSPPTPTQDERFAYTGEDVTPRLSIPIYEVTTPRTTGISIGKFVHMTRSKTKQLTLDPCDDAVESGMPYSDVSSDALSFSGSSVDSKMHHSPMESKLDVAQLGAVSSASKR